MINNVQTDLQKCFIRKGSLGVIYVPMNPAKIADVMSPTVSLRVNVIDLGIHSVQSATTERTDTTLLLPKSSEFDGLADLANSAITRPTEVVSL